MKVYINDKFRIFDDVKKHFDIVKDPDDADMFLSWEDTTQEFYDLIFPNHEYNHRLILTFQHGRRGIPSKFMPNTQCLVWGEKDKEEMGSGDKIHVCGCPLFKYLKPRKKHKGINLLFTPQHRGVSGNRGYIVDDEITVFLKKLKGINITTKLTELNCWKGDYINPVASDTQTPQHMDMIVDILSETDIVVSSTESTIELLAQYLDIPVVVCTPNSYITIDGDVDLTKNARFLKPGFLSTGVKETKLSFLLDDIKDQLANPDELKEGRKQSVIDFGGDIKNPIKKTVDIINKLYEQN